MDGLLSRVGRACGYPDHPGLGAVALPSPRISPCSPALITCPAPPSNRTSLHWWWNPALNHQLADPVVDITTDLRLQW